MESPTNDQRERVVAGTTTSTRAHTHSHRQDEDEESGTFCHHDHDHDRDNDHQQHPHQNRDGDSIAAGNVAAGREDEEDEEDEEVLRLMTPSGLSLSSSSPPQSRRTWAGWLRDGFSSGDGVGGGGRAPASTAAASAWGMLAVALVVGVVVGLVLGRSALPPPPPPEGISFVVVGDWGRDGEYNQSLVADSMGRVARAVRSQFVVSTGDNFYETGLADEFDAQFDSSFAQVYTAPSLATRWYSVLGNHDYVRNAAAQTGGRLRSRDPRWHCARNFRVKHDTCPPHVVGECRPVLELFFIDTSPMVHAYWEGPTPLNFTGVGDYTLNFQMELVMLKEALEESTARWKVVVGHHPIHSIGVHGDQPELVDNLLPLLQDHGVDMYVNGHDHCLQHIKRDDSPVTFVTSGAGSKAYRELRTPLPEEGVAFSYNGQGFVAATVDRRSFRLDFHDAWGHPLYSHTLLNSG